VWKILAMRFDEWDAPAAFRELAVVAVATNAGTLSLAEFGRQIDRFWEQQRAVRPIRLAAATRVERLQPGDIGEMFLDDNVEDRVGAIQQDIFTILGQPDLMATMDEYQARFAQLVLDRRVPEHRLLQSIAVLATAEHFVPLVFAQEVFFSLQRHLTPSRAECDALIKHLQDEGWLRVAGGMLDLTTAIVRQISIDSVFWEEFTNRALQGLAVSDIALRSHMLRQLAVDCDDRGRWRAAANCVLARLRHHPDLPATERSSDLELLWRVRCREGGIVEYASNVLALLSVREDHVGLLADALRAAQDDRTSLGALLFQESHAVSIAVGCEVVRLLNACGKRSQAKEILAFLDNRPDNASPAASTVPAARTALLAAARRDLGTPMECETQRPPERSATIPIGDRFTVQKAWSPGDLGVSFTLCDKEGRARESVHIIFGRDRAQAAFERTNLPRDIRKDLMLRFRWRQQYSRKNLPQ
jgi:hypothetical protein